MDYNSGHGGYAASPGGWFTGFGTPGGSAGMDSLPPPPVSYEEFDMGSYPGWHPPARERTSSLGARSDTTNYGGAGGPYAGWHHHPGTAPSPSLSSNGFSSATGRSTPAQFHQQQQQHWGDPSTSAAYIPAPSHQPQAQEPLFDPTEAALFSSFLHNMDASPSFLFNPVLPPDLPSPPAALSSVFETMEERKAHEGLGRAVGGMSLSGGGALLARRRGAEDEDATMRLSTNSSASLNKGKGKVKAEPMDDDVQRLASAGMRGDSLRAPSMSDEDGEYSEEEESAPAAPERVDAEEADGDPLDDDEEEEEEDEYAEPDDDPSFSPKRGRKTTAAQVPRPKRGKTKAVSSSRAKPAAGKKATAKKEEDEPSLSPQLEDEEDYDDDGSGAAGGSGKKTLTESQRRSNHILSEQKRRNAIRLGFRDLVDLLMAGEPVSCISVGEPDDDEDEPGGKKKKGKGRGRGRKGDIGVGASKSVVLEKAAEYLRWLEMGNEALQVELTRAQAALRS